MTESSSGDRDWGRDRAGRLLAKGATWLASESKENRWHTMLAEQIGALARLGGFPIPERNALNHLRDAPAAAFTAGVITNVPDVSGFMRRELPSGADLERLFDPYDHRVGEYIGKFTDPHLRYVVEGNLEQAKSHTVDDLMREELASACAVLGHLDAATELINSEGFPPNRRSGPVMVLCVESFRRGELDRATDLLREMDDLAGWHWVHLSAGFLDRVPWGGYPFPDF